MDRMKTFGMYALWIIAFFVFSTVVSKVLLNNSYKDMSSQGGVNIASSEEGLKVQTTEAKSNKMQGFYKGKIANTSDEVIPLKFMRVRSYSSGGHLLQTKYVRLEDLKPGETREFSCRFDVGGIDRYEVDYVDEMPDDRTFMDKMFENVVKFIKAEDKMDSLNHSMREFGLKPIDADIPGWAWLTAGLIVISSLPSGFLIIF